MPLNKQNSKINNNSRIGSKAENLKILKSYELKIGGFKVPDFISIPVGDFETYKSEILEKFKGKKVVIRSSSPHEDTKKNSNAGAYETILNVDTTEKELSKAYNKVQEQAMGKFGYNIPVVVQEMVENIKFSGVAFSKDPDTKKDYIVINYHEGIGENLVSGNETGKIIKIFKHTKLTSNDIFEKLAKIVKEVSKKYKQEVDIEFAINKNNEFFLLQVRPITTLNYNPSEVSKLTKRYISLLKNIFEHKDLVYGDMIDVNPEELVGKQPILIKTFFDWLFVKGVLRESRLDLGYSYKEFGMFVLDKYYIDLEKNLISFLPNSLDESERKIFIDYFKNLVKKDISAQKKLDSQLYPINIKRVEEILSEINISETKKQKILQKFKIFFDNLELKLTKVANNYFAAEKDIFNKLGVKNYYELIKLEDFNGTLDELLTLIKKTARYFVDYARGVFYFSSLQKSNPDYFKSNHYLSFIVKDYTNGEKHTNKEISFNNVNGFNFLELINQKIDIEEIKKQGYGKNYSCKPNLLDICEIGRENFKFIFMNLFRLLNKKIFQNLNNLTKENIKNIPFELLISYLKGEVNLDKLQSRKLHNLQKEELAKLFIMPPVLDKENNLDKISKFDNKGTFIGEGKLDGEVFYTENISKLQPDQIKGKILILENATPEIDVYLPYIKGIITKNGGPLAHIAIRARELKIPAIVGVGNLFNKIKEKDQITIDFDSKEIFF